jgi:peptidoglycan DL-endopeptidase CwlO
VQSSRTIHRRRSRAVMALGAALTAVAAGVLAPAPAGAAPGTAAEAATLLQEAAQQLTVIDEQVKEAELIVAAQQQAAATTAEQAAAAQAALAVYEPQLRAIAQSGYTGKTQSRVAAFLTSESAAELVQQMTTLDMIAAHTNEVVAEVSVAQTAAQQAQADADAAAATARSGLDQLAAQKAEVAKQAAQYQADFDRLTAAEQATVTAAVAGPALQAPRNLPMPSGAAGAAIETALAQVGDRYDHGGSGPDVFDCSGLTSYAYAAAGIVLPHSSRAQSQLGTQVSRSELQAGDLVFYGSPVAVTGVDQRGFRFGVRLG